MDQELKRFRVLGRITNDSNKTVGYVIIDTHNIGKLDSIQYLDKVHASNFIAAHNFNMQNVKAMSKNGKIVLEWTEASENKLTNFYNNKYSFKDNKMHVIASLWEGDVLNGYRVLLPTGMVKDMPLEDALERASKKGLANAKLVLKNSSGYISGIRQKIPKVQLGDPSDKKFLKIIKNL